MVIGFGISTSSTGSQVTGKSPEDRASRSSGDPGELERLSRKLMETRPEGLLGVWHGGSSGVTEDGLDEAVGQ